MRLWKSLHKFRGDAALTTYLTRIAINLSLNELKRRKRFLDRFISRDRGEDQPAAHRRCRLSARHATGRGALCAASRREYRRP